MLCSYLHTPVQSSYWLILLFTGATIPDPNSLKLNMLNEEELQALEGSERENVEARIGVLRNIQLLLDSAVVQMNQYYVATGK